MPTASIVMNEPKPLTDPMDNFANDEPVAENQVDANLDSDRQRILEQLESLEPIGRLEAVLFIAREPLHSRKLSQLAGLQDGTEARSLIRQLDKRYTEQGRAWCIKQVAGGFQLRTRPMFSDWLRKIQATESAPTRLSSPAMETLAVVAYRQPVLKAEIEAVRGVACGELLRQLLDRGLVRISGRSPELGNPYLYGTTRKFLEVFGLSNIETLPRADKLRGKGLPSWTIAPNAPQTPQSENPAKTGANPLDEVESNSQNVVDLDS